MTGPKDYRNRPCRSCGRTTTRAQCLDCRLIGHPATYSPDHALTGGQWVPGRHGVQVWVSNGAPPSTDEPDPEGMTTDGDIACLVCGVKPYEACRTPSGSAIKPHTGRLIPRQCRCGGPVTKGATNCEDCQAKNIAEREERREASRAKREREATCPVGHPQQRSPRGVLLACKTCKRERRRQYEAQRREAATNRQDAA